MRLTILSSNSMESRRIALQLWFQINTCGSLTIFFFRLIIFGLPCISHSDILRNPVFVSMRLCDNLRPSVDLWNGSLIFLSWGRR